MYIGGDIVRDGLVLHLDAGSERSYPKSGTVWKDLSGNRNDGTLTNGPTFDSGSGGSILLDGINDFVQIGYSSYWDSNVFGTATNFTLLCWAKPSVFMNWDTLISKANFATLGGWYSANEGAAIWTNSAGFQAVFSSGVASNPAGSTVILSHSTSNTQKWHHTCFTGDGTTLRFYIDGVQVTTGLVSSRTFPVSTSTVGPTFGRRDYLSGNLSTVMLYNRALTAEEVEKNYNATKKRFGL